MIFLGIDCGTQALKIVAWDPDTNFILSTSNSYDLIPGLPPGHKEQDPEVWIDALEKGIENLYSQNVQLSDVKAIGVSGQQHGLVVLDEDRKVLRPAKLWNDTSTEVECRQIIQRAGGLDSYLAETGNSLPPGFTASKILWLKKHEPEVYERARTFLLPHDYLNLYLTGNLVAEPGDASGTGYYNVRQREWSARALEWIDPERDLLTLLPNLIESTECAGTLRTPLATRWGLSSSVPVSSGGGDNMMGAIGSGNVRTGITTVSLGTSGTLYSYSPFPVIDPRGEVAAFCDSSGGWLPLVCTMNVTVTTEMIRLNFEIGDHNNLEAAVRDVSPGSDGLILIPYLEGERVPSVPAGTGVVLGLRPATATPAHLARSAMEGVTFGLRYGLDRMKELSGQAIDEIRLIGGGARSPAWRQIVADIFRVPVVCPGQDEGPAFGAALQAMACTDSRSIQEVADLYVGVREETRCLPSDDEGAYESLYQVYRSTSRTLIDSQIFEQHRKWIEGDREDE